MATIVKPPRPLPDVPLVTLTVNGVYRPLLSRKETAAALGLSTSTVADHIRRGWIPSVHLGKSVRVPACWIADLVRQAMEGRDAPRPGAPSSPLA